MIYKNCSSDLKFMVAMSGYISVETLNGYSICNETACSAGLWWGKENTARRINRARHIVKLLYTEAQGTRTKTFYEKVFITVGAALWLSAIYYDQNWKSKTNPMLAIIFYQIISSIPSATILKKFLLYFIIKKSISDET